MKCTKWVPMGELVPDDWVWLKHEELDFEEQTRSYDLWQVTYKDAAEVHKYEPGKYHEEIIANPNDVLLRLK